ncbi:MAG: response regulator [Halobacteriovoraceae bacterium]|nr:response regulator [Halobacteriovoraceae bacterium]
MIRRPFQLLLVDDNEGVREIVEISIREKFNEEFINIIPMETAKEALAYAKDHTVHIVFTDIHMRGSFGDSLIRECHKLEKGIQVVVMSGDTKFTTVSNCYLDGARFFIVKPFTDSDIQDSIRHCLYELEAWEKIFAQKITPS